MRTSAEKIKLIAFDLDNTILPPGEKEISQVTKDALNAAKEKGLILFLNTGRHYTFIPPSIFKDVPMDYIGTINGACLVKKDGTVLHKHPISEKNMKDIVVICDKEDIGLGFKFEDAIVTYVDHEKFVEGYVQKGTPWENSVIDNTAKRDHHLTHGYPLGTFMVGGNEVLRAFIDNEDDLHFAWSYRGGYDVFLKTVTKATCVEEVMDYYGLSWENVIAFGDAGNDIAFVEKAGIGVAMKNGKDHIFEHCDMVADTCSNDGFAKTLKELGII